MIAWLGGGWNSAGMLVRSQHPSMLISFYYDQSFDKFKEHMMKPTDLRFFVDSGAFSAWNSGKEIDLDEYCEFVRHNIEQIDVYANLDAIPGEKGRLATPAEREQAAAQSWETYLYMREQGLDPIPVFHCGEDFKWLQQMLDYGCTYIGLGGMVGITREQRKQWLDRCFTMLTNPDGSPIVKTHGFGMTAIPLIFRYPWYSVDSTAWLRVAGSGDIYVPTVAPDGSFLFDVTPNVVSVSESHPGLKRYGDHGDHLPPSMKEVLERWLKECDVTYEQVRSHYEHRAVCCIQFFKRVSETKIERPFSNRVVVQEQFV